MNNQELFQKYIKEHCQNCKNKNSDLCDIRISRDSDVVVARCGDYRNDDIKKRKKIPAYFQGW